MRVIPGVRGSEESRRRLVRFVDRVFGPRMTVEGGDALRHVANPTPEVLDYFRRLTGRDPEPGEVIPMKGPSEIDLAALAKMEVIRRKRRAMPPAMPSPPHSMGEELRERALKQKAKEMRSAWWRGFTGMFLAAMAWSGLSFAMGVLWMTPLEGLPSWAPPVIGWVVLATGCLVLGQSAGNGARREVIDKYQGKGE